MTCCSLDNYSVWHGSSQLYVTSLFAQSSNWRFVFPATLLCLQGNTGQHHLLADVFIWKLTVNFEYMDTSDALYLETGNNNLCAQIERSLKPKSFVLQLFSLPFQNWKIYHGRGYWAQSHNLPDYTWSLSLGPKHPERCRCKMFSESSRSIGLT